MSNENNHIYGKKVWIIGASTGIGAALARELALEGATILASSRNPDALDAMIDSLPGLNHEAWPLDVEDCAGFAETAKALVAQHPDVEMALYNAGVYDPKFAHEVSLDESVKTININLTGALVMVDVLLPLFKSRKAGRFIFMGSVGGYFGLPRALSYSASKAGIISMAETLKVELAEDNIAVQVVCPGFVRTRLTQNNPFPMPFIITPEKAAVEIVKGIEAGSFEIHFPKQFSFIMKALALLPRVVRCALLRQAVKKLLKPKASDA